MTLLEAMAHLFESRKFSMKLLCRFLVRFSSLLDGAEISKTDTLSVLPDLGYKPFFSGIPLHPLKSCLAITSNSGIALIFRLISWAKIGILPTVKSISISMVDKFNWLSHKKSMKCDSSGKLLVSCAISISLFFSRNYCGVSIPATLRSLIYILRFNKRKHAFSEWNISNTWANDALYRPRPFHVPIINI